MRLSLSKVIAFGFILPCFGLLTSDAGATVPPVVRANAAVKQISLCYIEMPGIGWQNLDNLCFTGKDMSRSRPIDMVTDRDGDGIPDDLTTFFQRMDEGMNLPTDASPATQQAEAEKLRQVLKEFAERAPIDTNVKAAFKKMADIMYTVAESAAKEPSKAQLQQWESQSKSMDQITEILDRDPFMQGMQKYWNKYEELKYK